MVGKVPSASAFQSNDLGIETVVILNSVRDETHDIQIHSHPWESDNQPLKIVFQMLTDGQPVTLEIFS